MSSTLDTDRVGIQLAEFFETIDFAPTTHDAWRDQAACRSGVDPDLFFPERGASMSDARAVCASCPVRQPCAAYAIREGIGDGIWGGMTGPERRDFIKWMGLRGDDSRSGRARSRR